MSGLFIVNSSYIRLVTQSADGNNHAVRCLTFDQIEIDGLSLDNGNVVKLHLADEIGLVVGDLS